MEYKRTTAGYKNTYSYDRLIGMLVRMITQPDRCMVLGGTWRTPVAMGLQSKTFITDQKDEGTFNEASFEREYESVWTGTVENAFFNGDVFDRNRVINQPEYEWSGRSTKAAYYVIGVDVARTKGDNTVASIIKVTPQQNGAAIKSLVNIYSWNDEHFEDQAKELKRLYYKYKAQRLVIDGNGNGVGLIDFMVKPQIDLATGEVLNDFGVVNDDKDEYRRFRTNQTELDAIYIIKANAPLNSEAHSNLQMQLSSGKLKLLIDEKVARQKLLATKAGQKMSTEQRSKYLYPFTQTSILREEMLNLREETEGINIILRQANKSIRKDHFSSLEYALYYIRQQEDRKSKKKKFIASEWRFFN